MNAHRTTLHLPHGQLKLPTFLPDATLGVVRSVDSVDLEQCGVEGGVMNNFDLMQRAGYSTITALGGLHQMSGWPRPIITDSGGFQAYSLIRQNSKFGQMNDKGITFQPEGSDRKFHLTPEKSIQLQLSYGADIAVCLDDCTHVDYSLATQQESVKRTIEWARRCKSEFERPMHALGIGHPANVVECARLGYDIFDSAMPTRDARHARLYVFTTPDSLPAAGSSDQWFSYLYVNDDKAIKNDGPISRFCDCLCCSRYSVAYLHHLFKINDGLFLRLATMHNLRFMAQLSEPLSAEQY